MVHNAMVLDSGKKRKREETTYIDRSLTVLQCMGTTADIENSDFLK